MRLSTLLLCAALLEAGWLAVWPLSVALSHSPLFTAAMLDTHPAIGALFADTLQVAHRLLPGLSDAPMQDPLGSPSYATPTMALAMVMVWLVAIYASALLAFDRGFGSGRLTPLLIFGGAVIFQVTLLASPGLFSQDVFSYIAYGRLAAVYELNPYIWPPSVLHDPVVNWVAEVWRTYASPYGPAWVNVQWVIARLDSSLPIVDQALVYRALANVLLLVNLGLAWRLLGRLTPLNQTQRTTALAALAWNPLLLFEVAGNAHNDVLMVTLSLLGLLTFTHSSRGVVSGAALTVGALVKYLSGLGVAWVALASAARATEWKSRVLRVMVIGLTSVGLLAALAAPWLELPDSLDPLLDETAGVGYVNSLPDRLLVMLLRHVGGPLPLDLARSAERIAILSLFGLYLLWEVRQVWCDPNRGTVARALARSCLLYVLLVSTSVQTWYFCLPISIAVALGWRRRITRLTLAYSALALPAIYVSYYMRENTPSWIFLVYACAPLLVLVPDVIAARRRTLYRRTATAPSDATAEAPNVSSQRAPVSMSMFPSRSSTRRSDRPATTNPSRHG